LFVAGIATACTTKEPTKASVGDALDSTAHLAHANYVRVINANNTDSLMSMLTEDVVFLAANDKPVVGKPAVRA
jgi:ketosteroid isomerase-like protein